MRREGKVGTNDALTRVGGGGSRTAYGAANIDFFYPYIEEMMRDALFEIKSVTDVDIKTAKDPHRDQSVDERDIRCKVYYNGGADSLTPMIKTRTIEAIRGAIIDWNERFPDKKGIDVQRVSIASKGQDYVVFLIETKQKEALPKAPAFTVVKKHNMNESQLFESILKENSSDGWSDEIRDNLEESFSSLESLMYEVRNCIKGCYTGCSTSEELANHIKMLADGLSDAAEYVRGCPDSDEDEDDED